MSVSGLRSGSGRPAPAVRPALASSRSSWPSAGQGGAAPPPGAVQGGAAPPHTQVQGSLEPLSSAGQEGEEAPLSEVNSG